MKEERINQPERGAMPRPAALSIERPGWIRYGAAFLSVAAAILVRFLLDPMLGDSLPFLVLFGGVAIAVSLGGWQPATLAALLGFLATIYWFVPPRGIILLNKPILWVGGIGYALSCGLIIWMGEALRRSRHRAEQHGERLEQEIIERKRADEARFRLAAIIESSDDAILSKDLNGIIKSWNAGAERIFGYTASETVGRPVTMLIPTDRLDEESGILGRIRRGERVEHYETIRRHKDGTSLNVSLAVSPIVNNEGQIIGASKIARDITRRKRADEALREAHELLGDRAKQLENLVEKRTADLRDTVQQLEIFSYSIVHDMRAPLRSMTSFASILESEYHDKLDETGRNYLDRIVKSATRLDALITDVLTYSRLSTAETPLIRVDLDKLVTEIVENYPQFQEKAELIHIQHPLPAACGNAALLTQIVSNLLGNALKFVPPGRTPRAVVGAENGLGKVRLWIEDNGIGIPSEQRERIFGLFQRLHRPDEFAGTGVGLAIVKKAAERMGGKVGVESAPGTGSRFWVELEAASNKTRGTIG
jgi:PAS domain S-box-containing protein